MVKVSKDACIGCGACQGLVSEVFDINDDGFAYVLDDAKIDENIDNIKEAVDNCPTGAITFDEN